MTILFAVRDIDAHPARCFGLVNAVVLLAQLI
jgi:hypothetical protein